MADKRHDVEEAYFILLKKWKDFCIIFRAEEGGIKTVSEFVSAIENMFYAHDRSNHTDELFIYRGEGQTYNTFLLPAIIRDNIEYIPYKNRNITQQEVEEIARFQRSDTGRAFRKYLGSNASDWVYLTQHYRNEGNYITRLMDVTKNPLIALYFTCEKEMHFDKDGWVFMMPVKSLRPQTIPLNQVRTRDIEQGIPDSYMDLYEDTKIHPVSPGIPHLYEPLEPSTVDRRLSAQAGAFMWWHPLEPSNKINYFSILVNSEAKTQIKQDLDRIFNINEASLFP